MSKYAKRKDQNHDEIKQAVIDAGWCWSDTYQFTGVLLDGIVARDGITVLVEVKYRNGQLTERERDVMDTWPGERIIAFTPSQAVAQLADISARYARLPVAVDDLPF